MLNAIAGSSHGGASAGGLPPPTLFLSDADVAALADWSSAVEALERAYAAPMEPGMVPPRSMARAPGKWLRGLTAVSPSGRLGCKLIAASTRDRCASYLISLFDDRTTALLALIDGNRVTGIRTAATATVAVKLVAPRKPLRVAVIGSGFEATSLLSALSACLPIASARAYSPTPASRERFAQTFRNDKGLNIAAAASAAEAIGESDVVLCAARSRDESPVLCGEWLAPGMTVVSLGSTLPEQREVDEQVMARAERIIADMPDEVLRETGDALAAVRAGVDVAGKLVSLADVAAGRVPGRQSSEDIVVYKSVGSALQDIVISELLFERARTLGRGIALPASIVPVAK
jgi:ornithine cyclodeaminase/alanine dehydrogenase-like protein (mu-crystallin family)